MRSAWFATLIITLGQLGCSGNGVPAWIDSPGSEKSFGPYRFELPSGFEEQSVPNTAPGVNNGAWAGPKNRSAEPVIVCAYTAHDMDISIEEPSWVQAADRSLQGLHEICGAVSIKDRRRVQINGMEAMRTEATGRTRDRNVELNGVIYFVIDHENAIVLTALNGGPNADRSIKRLDESLLTFRRPGYKPPAKAAVIADKPNKTVSLSEARRGFQTKLKPSEFPSEPMDQPPPNEFTIVEYESAVGQLGAYLTPDPGDGHRHPAILWITGGDCNTIGDVWTLASIDNDQTAGAYRKAGIVMMFPSLRGGNRNPGCREGFLGEADDVLAAADFLAQQTYVDPARIYLGGHSTGGTLALLVSACSDRFRAVFSFGPADNVIGYGKTFLPFDYSDPRELELRSPILWLHSIKRPTFVLEGENGNAESIPAMKKVADNPQVHFFLIEGEDHFTILAPMNQLLADKILEDQGPDCNLSLTEAEIAAELNPSRAHSLSPIRLGSERPAAAEITAELRRQAEEREREQQRERAAEAIRQDPSHPDYIKVNIADLRSTTGFESRHALDRLLRIRPEDVTDKQTRSELARAMRDVACDSSLMPPDREKAVQGLVTWGSNYSVPLLLQLLEEKSPFLQEAVVTALKQLKDERAIEPLAERFAASTFPDDEIVDCLRAFGPQAEDAVLKHASTANPMKLRKTVELLGDIGTLKSIRFFTTLRKDRQNAFILGRELDAATEAIKQRSRN